MSKQTPNDKRQSKGKHFKAQMAIVFDAFMRNPSTMLMVEVETRISRSNICRYVAKWKKSDLIKIIKLCICPISKHSGVQRLTTNPKLFPVNLQTKLF